MSELLTIEAVKVDADLQAREALNADTVTAYAAHLLGMAPPPEIALEDANLSPMAQRFYAPVTVVAVPQNGGVTLRVVNDTPVPLRLHWGRLM